jgi:hypothetical protein
VRFQDSFLSHFHAISSGLGSLRLFFFDFCKLGHFLTRWSCSLEPNSTVFGIGFERSSKQERDQLRAPAPRTAITSAWAKALWAQTFDHLLAAFVPNLTSMYAARIFRALHAT